MKRTLALLTLVVAALVTLGFLGSWRPWSGTGLASNMRGPDVGGKIVYAKGGALWVYRGGENHQLTKGPVDRNDKRDAQPSFSPDGNTIVYVRFDEGYSDLYKLDIDYPGDPVALTNNRPKGVEVGQVGTAGQPGWSQLALWSLFPAFSPDGSRILYTSDIGTQYPGLFTMPAGGGTPQKMAVRLDFSQQAIEEPVWSPDGTKLAGTTYITKDFKGQIWVFNTDTSKWTEITAAQDGAYDPAWSPDGAWLAFTMRQGTLNNIYVVPTDASQWTGDHPTPIEITTDGASRSPSWSPDGTHIAYLSNRDDSIDLYVGEIQKSPTGQPALGPVQRLTENAHLDGPSGVSWGQ